jgi:peptidoglycan/LPS O-acetylase OafA/YrhL
VRDGRHSAKGRQFHTLDGLRGIAATAVVAFHAKDFFGPFRPQSAYLAVDFFFVLSGFVLAYAYDDRLGSRMSASAFFRRRVIRLFPLYLVGSALAAGAAGMAVFVVHDAAQWSVGRWVIAVLLAAAMLPSPVTVNLFPLNIPSWSLFFELVANGVYGTRVWQGRRIVWIVVLLAAVGVLLEAIVTGTTNNGAEWGDLWWSPLVWGACRVGYSFPLGLLLYRHRAALRFPRCSPVLLALILIAVLCCDPAGSYRIPFDLAFVLVVSPALVMIGAQTEPAMAWQTAACAFLGAISYPIYALHNPILMVLNGVYRRILRGPIGPIWQPWIGIALLAALVVVAALAGRADQRLRYAGGFWRPAPSIKVRAPFEAVLPMQ